VAKVTLEFQIPEEETECRLAQDGTKWHLVVTGLLVKLRGKIKYEDQETVKLEDVRTWVHELLDEYGLKVD